MLIRHKDFNFSFDCSKCDECGGKCCIGKSGNIWITVQELAPLAQFLKLSKQQLLDNYIEKRGYRLSLREVHLGGDDYRCIFFDMQTKRCQIYDYRPKQCSTFPFWPSLKDDREYLKDECIGVVFE
ncbi:MAG: YkgJ family cysteine cluster protein [Campylobacterota bacterium]